MTKNTKTPAKKDSVKTTGYIMLIVCCVLAVALCVALVVSELAPTPEAKGLYADIVIEDYGTITVKLEPDSAPITVENFVKLAEEGFYDGLTFHRIKKDFMMQGGDPDGNGSGGSDTTIKGEFTANGVENNLSHTRGAISMARSGQYDSGSSQFFIMHKDRASLDGQYAVFGYVTKGIEIVDEICNNCTGTGANNLVDKDDQPVITTITIREVN